MINLDAHPCHLSNAQGDCQLNLQNGWKINAWGERIVDENQRVDDENLDCAEPDSSNDYLKCLSSRVYGSKLQIDPIQIPKNLEAKKAHSIVIQALNEFQGASGSENVKRHDIGYNHVKMEYKTILGQQIQMDVQIEKHKVHIRCRSTFEGLKGECDTMRERILNALKV